MSFSAFFCHGVKWLTPLLPLLLLVLVELDVVGASVGEFAPVNVLLVLCDCLSFVG